MRTAPVEPAVYGSTNTSGVEKKPIINCEKSPKIIADAVVNVPLVRSDGTLLVTAKSYPYKLFQGASSNITLSVEATFDVDAIKDFTFGFVR